MLSTGSAAREVETGIPNISLKEFARIAAFIYKVCGIKLPPAKKGMLTARLAKRMKALQMNNFADYIHYVESPQGQKEELTLMINAVSTNKTDFFREPGHFDFLCSEALPTLERMSGHSQRLAVWSAGCSSGEEPYTLAMVLSECSNTRNFHILATDISTRTLDIAAKAVYPENLIEPIPMNLRRKYLLRGKGKNEGVYKITPELRNLITFRRLNLMDSDFGIRNIDIIFCRNVIIYFDRETQIELFRKYYNAMSPGGYLFIGHSETLDGISEKFIRVAPTIYRRPE
ncbi:MAG TPA: protein-glutamate O-methyltransferase [Nitrospirota bacterium]|jgi:chemotaxis protein methyltransferase CheR